jgi:hypothetical protein
MVKALKLRPPSQADAYSAFAQAATRTRSLRYLKMSDDEYSANDDGQFQFPFCVNPNAPRGAATSVSDVLKRRIFELRAVGHIQSDIAALLGLNQGRVSEVLRGLR